MRFIIALLATVGIGVVLMFIFRKKKKPELTVEEKVDTALQDAEKQVSGFRTKIAELMSKKAELDEDLGYAEEEVAKWTLIVQSAVKTEKESNVRTAVQSRLEAEQVRDRIGQQARKMSHIVEGLEEQLRFAQTRIDDAKANRTTLGVRLDAAKIRENLADKNINLADLEDETIRREATAEAYEETSPEHQDFMRKNVVSHLDVDSEVQRLMKK